MARAHERLYDDAARRPRRGAAPRGPAAPGRRAAPMRFRAAAAGGTPLVSVICRASTTAASCRSASTRSAPRRYPALEIDRRRRRLHRRRDARAARRARARADDVTVLRLPENGGPSRARNAGARAARGRYVLPVDADNLLLPTRSSGSSRSSRAPASRSASSIPNLQYFGNRERLLRGARRTTSTALLQRQLLRHLLAVRPRASSTPACASPRTSARPRGLGLRAAARRARRPRRARARPRCSYRKSGFNRARPGRVRRASFHDASCTRATRAVRRRRERAIKARAGRRPPRAVVALRAPAERRSDAPAGGLAGAAGRQTARRRSAALERRPDARRTPGDTPAARSTPGPVAAARGPPDAGHGGTADALLAAPATLEQTRARVRRVERARTRSCSRTPARPGGTRSAS